MINVESMVDRSQVEVLLALGDNLLKEQAYAESFYNEAASEVGLFQKALDFISRTITKFLAWLRKKKLDRCKERLTKLKDNVKVNDQFADPKTMYTYFYPDNWFGPEVMKPCRELHELSFAKIIASGQVKDIHKILVNRDMPKLEHLCRILKEAVSKVNKFSVPAGPVNVSHEGKGSIETAIKFIDHCSTTVYQDLQKSLASIKVIKDYEKGKNLQDSKAVSDSWTHAMTLLAQAYLNEMAIAIDVEKTLTAGATVRRISSMGKQKVYNELELNDLYTAINEIFNNDINPASKAVYANTVKMGENAIRVDIVYSAKDGTNKVVSLNAKKLADATERFINKGGVQGRPITKGMLK